MSMCVAPSGTKRSLVAVVTTLADGHGSVLKHDKKQSTVKLLFGLSDSLQDLNYAMPQDKSQAWSAVTPGTTLVYASS